jgi:phosphoribosylformylglycinamidine cyclo-ligase
MSQRHDAYAAAGVDYTAVDPGKLLAQRTALDTASALASRGLSEVTASRGESAYAIDLGDRYLTMVTEALGTKNLVADATRGVIGQTYYELIARDTVATILNDLATLGGTPVALTAYWASGRSEWFEDQDRMAALVSGWGEACQEARCSWGGGETQVLTGMIDPNTVVLGGSAVGTIRPRSHLLLGSRVAAGDAILIAPSSGIHANGLTLARKLTSQLADGYQTKVPGDPEGRSYGRVLLDPSPLYGPLVEALQTAGLDLHYTAHVTGHGWRKLMRAEQNLTYAIDQLPAVPPVLQLIAQTAGLAPDEAYATFNMGAGYVFYLPEAQADRALEVGRALGRPLQRAGQVEPGPRRVVLRPLGITYEGASLAIR